MDDGMARGAAAVRIMAAVLFGLSWLAAGPAIAGTTQRVSVASNGAQGNQWSEEPSLSGDGRFVAFTSYASNLVSGDTLGITDIFVRDRQTSETTRVSIASGGAQANSGSYEGCISADGQLVAFTSYASNLVSGDTNDVPDVFVRDRQAGQTTRVSTASAGTQGNGESRFPSISADGRFVAFVSFASNLVLDDTNEAWDVFVHDRQTGQTIRVDVASDGSQSNDGSGEPSISADGRFVAFSSSASNLVPDDTNEAGDVFVHDRQTAQTTRVSLASDGTQLSSSSYDPSISADGRFVAFDSYDVYEWSHVFVHDRQTGQTTCVSVAPNGAPGNSDSFSSSISADGRLVAFASYASNLVSNDSNDTQDVFVRNRLTGQTTRVSVASDGSQGNSYSYMASISGDGRFVAFLSWADNLVPGDTNSREDIFVHDRLVHPVFLTVNGGTGSGVYEQGEVAAINATPPAGYRFDRWTGSVQNVADIYSASTTITMLADATVTAAFVQQFNLSVIGGTGTGAYDTGTVVAIAASIPTGYRFDRWIGDVQNVADIYSASTTITMLADATVTATFVQQFSLSVAGGSGTGTYDTGTVVAIAADIPAGYRFDRWTGDVQNVADVHSASTTITMLADATVTATFAPIRKITGCVWNDLNGNGVRGSMEPALHPWIVWLDANTNGTMDPGEIGATTDDNGCYVFEALHPGSYVVAQFVPPGWTQTFPLAGPQRVDLRPEADAEGADFGCRVELLGDISGDGCVNITDLLIVRNLLGKGSCR